MPNEFVERPKLAVGSLFVPKFQITGSEIRNIFICHFRVIQFTGISRVILSPLRWIERVIVYIPIRRNDIGIILQAPRWGEIHDSVIFESCVDSAVEVIIFGHESRTASQMRTVEIP